MLVALPLYLAMKTTKIMWNARRLPTIVLPAKTDNEDYCLKPGALRTNRLRMKTLLDSSKKSIY
jgi:hypothetical protein